MKLFTRHPFFLASVRLKDRSQLPSKPGVYYAVSHRNPSHVLYVGMAANLRKRWGGDRHHKLETLLNYPSVHLHYRELRSEAAAERREAHDIKRYRPPLNDRNERTPWNPIADLGDALSDICVVFSAGFILTAGIAIGLQSSPLNKAIRAGVVRVK